MPDLITIKQCLDIMKTGAIFSLTCVRYDRRRKKGGDLLEIAEAQLLTAEQQEAETAKRQQRPLTASELQALRIEAGGRTPNHRHWHTRNVRILCDGHPTAEIRKVHPPLFLTFNGRTVVP